MNRGTLLALVLSALAVLAAGCDDPAAKASLEVCLENRETDPRLAQILCQQSMDHAPDSPSGRQAAAILHDLQATSTRPRPTPQRRSSSSSSRRTP